MRRTLRDARRALARRRNGPGPFPDVEALGISGRRFDFDDSAGTEVHRSIARGWDYEPDVMAVLLACLSGAGPRLFVDVGANIGYFPIVVGGLLGPDVHCVAYEPTPSLADRLAAGARNNDVAVELRPVAVGAVAGAATFYLSAKTDASNSLNGAFRRHRGAISVAVTTLDEDLLVRFPTRLENRPVLLIDTETTEPDVLAGAAGLIEVHRPGIVCEVLAGRTEEPLGEFLTASGYRPYALARSGIEVRDEVVGDPSYAHRDWLFWPEESEPPQHEIAAACAAIMPTV